MERFDVIVVGAGVAGSAAAYHLAKKRRVLLLEQFTFLHALGSSHGGSRIFRHAYEDRRYVRLCVEADERWQALERDAGDKLLYRTGGLDIGRRENAELARIETALRDEGRPVERLSAADVARRFPAYRLDDEQSALYQPDAGILAASRCLAAMQRLAAARGAKLVDRAPASVDLDEGSVRVKTPKGDFEAERLIVTAGAWLGTLLHELGLPLRIEQQQVVYVRVKNAPRFSLGAFPLFIHRDEWVYGFPLFENPVAIKASDHVGAPEITLETRRDTLMEARAKSTIQRLKSFLPGVTDEICDYQLCLYTKTPDEHFILDRHPAHPHVVIGGGFSGHGFKFGPLVGEILAELAFEGSSRHDLERFTLDRLTRTATA
jgi:monomeric sarcosine oxidase